MWQDVKELPTTYLESDVQANVIKIQKAAADGLFDTFSTSFEALSARADDLLAKHFQREVTGELKPYLFRCVSNGTCSAKLL